ncbi:hypothetical protein EUX98_g8959 [Antrodiella citrinella]|uniref:Kinesin motor domain-containing protein n=1 Tax=Antrodiella citrinella TaxID=2447956 RepID=A0A4V3XFQ5_9APHY|nr:hypothetical protein EUX98_g8959 [Antrodiella citrinella]
MAPPQPSGGPTTSVQVALRIRPTTTQDASSIPARFQRTVINSLSSTSISIDLASGAPSSIGSSAAPALTSAANSKKQVFTFDQVHPPSTTQHALFTATAQPLISRFVEGFNCTILAYGQTSSGKTFSMTGIDLDADPSDPNNGMGIIPRAVSTIFSRCKEMKEERANAWNYSIKSSFIEIYNEDLIDLLSLDDTGGGRREVQIREDKQGHIIWEGLREIGVKNAGEVMTLLRKGTSIRRTNETDMNAQSSRSHAIFSLTLIQKKFVGSGPPPRSSSPLPPGGRSPSRIARPGSYMGQSPASAARISSPTFGRPPTPSFAVAMGRGGARPSSSLGMLTPEGGRGANGAAAAGGEDEPGEWITVVSKFHFVDLAGSERLKRTAAAGERIKEGISINSGLLALGNVISALGDPAKARSNTASYVPYRDSKLTRLLQDSLGGNAHTLMVACVSPAEWNAAETVNTLKYANRARNIKNRAVVNEKEEGWDDVEWLQGMVTRLRRDLKEIKENGGISISTNKQPEVLEGAGKKVLAQMAELQNNYEDLREKFVDRTEELTRLRRDLAEKQRSKGGHIGGMAKYEEIVGPVIEEYEKTISAMEAELNLNRAALRHTNEMVEEKEVELAQLSERQSTTEMYVEELRSRVSKLSEREASTEAYVRDLEDRVKSYDETSVSSSGSISDLKRELVKYRDTESHSAQYITDLETRLARSDESVLVLRETVEHLEHECQRRRDEAEALQLRLDSITQDGQSWRSDLEQRERKVRALEQKMEEWEAKRKEAGEDRERLTDLVSEVTKAKKNFEENGSLKINGSSQTPSEVSSINEPESVAQSELVALQQTHTATLADLSSVTAKYRDALREIADLAAQLQEAKVSGPPPIREDVSESTDAPSETPSPSPRRRMTRGAKDEPQVNGQGRRLFFRQPASAESLHNRSLSQSVSLSQELSSARSRQTSISSHGTSSSISLPSPHRPNLSISVSSPNERSVQSLEQEIMRLQEVLKERETEITALEGSLRERERAPAQPEHNGTALNGDGPHVNGGGTAPEVSAALAHLSPKTRSQFQELRRSLDGTLSPPPVDTDDIHDPEHGDSLNRLNELMRSMAQKESSHKEEIDQLEDELNSVRRQHDELVVLSRDQTVNMSMEIEALGNKHHEDLVLLDELKSRETELVTKLAEAEATHLAAVEELKVAHAEALKEKAFEVDVLVSKLKQEHSDVLQDALQASGSDAEAIASRLQEEHDAALRAKKADAEALVASLKEEHEGILRAKEADVEALVSRLSEEHNETLRTKEADAQAAIARANEEHETALQIKIVEAEAVVARLKREHALVLEDKDVEAEKVVAKLAEDHLAAVVALRVELTEASVALEKAHQEHQAAFGKLKSDHEAELRRRSAEVDDLLERTRKEHDETIAKTSADYEETIKRKEAETAATLSRTEEEYYEALTKLRSDHAASLEKQAAESATALERLKSEHIQHMHMADIAREGSLSESESAREASLKELQQAHADAMAQKDVLFLGDLQRAKEEHAEALKTKDEQHRASVQRLKADHVAVMHEKEAAHIENVEKLETAHDTALKAKVAEHATALEKLTKSHESFVAKLQLESGEDLKKLSDELAGRDEELVKAKEVHAKELDEALAAVKEQQAMIFQEVEKSHEEEIAKLKEVYEVVIKEARSQAEEQSSSSGQSHFEELGKLQAEHQQTITELQAKISLTEDKYREELEASHARTEELLEAEREASRSRSEELLEAEREASRARSEELLEAERARIEERLEAERTRLVETIAELEAKHADEKAQLLVDQELLVEELASHKAASDEFASTREQMRQSHETLTRQKDNSITRLQEQLAEADQERRNLHTQLTQIRADLENARAETTELVKEASKRESLIDEIEKHRSVVAEMQDNLQRTKDEMDTLQAERNRQDHVLRDLQAQLSRSPSPGARPDRGMSISSRLPPAKLPPLSPPPAVPPPPTPKDSHASVSTILTSSSCGIDSPLESPTTAATSIAHSMIMGSPRTPTSPTPDPKILLQVQEQSKLLEEQDSMIKTLNKQLSHCESDLQAHMDLVNTLETSLADSEKNLRKARMQATELARERDNLNTQISGLRSELNEAKSEVVSVRRSIVEEKQSLENRLDEERKAKERARAQLDSRMDELQRRKSKFACL